MHNALCVARRLLRRQVPKLAARELRTTGAAVAGVPVLSHRWVLDSIGAGKLLGTIRFLMTGEAHGGVSAHADGDAFS